MEALYFFTAPSPTCRRLMELYVSNNESACFRAVYMQVPLTNVNWCGFKELSAQSTPLMYTKIEYELRRLFADTRVPKIVLQHKFSHCSQSQWSVVSKAFIQQE